MTRIFGLLPDAAAGAAGVAGAAFCACASAPELIAAAAASVDVPNRMLRRLSALSFEEFGVRAPGCLLLVLPLAIPLSSCSRSAITALLRPFSHSETRDGWSTYRSLPHAAPPAGSGGNSSVRTDASRP